LIFKNRRSQLDLLGEILLNADGLKRSHLLAKTGMSYKQFVKYVNFLVEKEFLKEVKEENSKIYSLTESGGELLNDINEIIKKLM